MVGGGSEVISPVKQAANAIRWIDSLPSRKQASFINRGRLGDPDRGYCCLGAGCEELDVPYLPNNGASQLFARKVALLSLRGDFQNKKTYYKKTSLIGVNDYTNAGFKRISRLMRTHPEWMFKPEVAKLIRAYYERKDSIKVPKVVA